MNVRLLGLLGTMLCAVPAIGSQARAQPDERYELVPRALALGLRTSGVYDSNIDHDETDLDSHGVMAGIEARLQTRGRRPLLSVTYEGTLRRFSRTSRWDRVEHRIAGVMFGESGPLTMELRGQVDFKGATENRELGNLYTLSPRTSLSVGPVRVRAYAALRLKRIDDAADPERPDRQWDDVLVYAGGEVRWRSGGGSSWSVGYRYEDSYSESPSRNYRQQRYIAEYRAELTERAEVELGLEYRPRRFPEKLVEVERLGDGGDPAIVEEPREDTRWIPYASLSHVFPWGQEVELEYEYQSRASNDPDKEFEAHRLMLTLRLPLISRYRKIPIED